MDDVEKIYIQRDDLEDIYIYIYIYRERERERTDSNRYRDDQEKIDR